MVSLTNQLSARNVHLKLFLNLIVVAFSYKNLKPLLVMTSQHCCFVDQLDKIEEIDNMVGNERTLLLFNRQFTRPADFGFNQNEKCNRIVFDRFTQGFAFQEFACRGEDVKLTFEYPNWQSCIICDEDEALGSREIALLDPQPTRPLYDDLEKKINEVLPEPLWMRKMGEAETKGFKFQRGQKDE